MRDDNRNLEQRIIKLEQQVSELHDIARITNKEIHNISEVKIVTEIFALIFIAVALITKIFGK